jgi:hypothetical protein
MDNYFENPQIFSGAKIAPPKSFGAFGAIFFVFPYGCRKKKLPNFYGTKLVSC